MPPTAAAYPGVSRMAATVMMQSFKYKCPPGTGTPKELMMTFMAIRRADTVKTLI